MLNENRIQEKENDAIIAVTIQPDENFPNNPDLPVLIYKHIFDFSEEDSPVVVERILHGNNWGNSWRNGIYSFHHYHANAHEALGVYRGWAEVQLGGSNGNFFRIEKGDLVVLPAGVSHKRIDSGDGFAVVGAYPEGQFPDMFYGKDGERPKTDQIIENVALPDYDPIFGKKGVLFEHWK